MDAVIVVGLVGLAARDVADLLEAEVDGIVGPHVDRVADDGMEGLGHVEVAHAAAHDAGGAGAGSGLVQPLMLPVVPQHDFINGLLPP